MLDEHKSNVLMIGFLPYVGILFFNLIIIAAAFFLDAESWGIVALLFAGIVFLFSTLVNLINIFSHREWDAFTTRIALISGTLMFVGFMAVLLFLLYSVLSVSFIRF